MTVGTPPGTGFQLVDGNWLNGLAGGTNNNYVSGLAAPNAASQATATPIPSNVEFVEIDSAVPNGSLVLPLAIAGTQIACINTVAQTVNYYANAGINPLTGAQDTINGASNATPFNTSTSAAVIIFYCAKNGSWRTK